MAIWYVDVATEEGARKALKSGVIGAVCFGGLATLGALMSYYGHPVPVYGSDSAAGSAPDLGRVSSAIGSFIEAPLAFVCAWRFHCAKGRFWGLFTILLLLLEIGNKVLTGMHDWGFYLMLSAILAALINGVRGAWAIRGASEAS